MAQPDLHFYFSKSNSTKKLAYDTSIALNIVFSIPLYAERELINIIGHMVGNTLVFTEKGSNVINGGILTSSFTFDFGNFVAQTSDLPTSSGSTPEIIPNAIVIASITSGNKDFLGAQGYVVIVSSDEAQVSDVKVFLTNK